MEGTSNLRRFIKADALASSWRNIMLKVGCLAPAGLPARSLSMMKRPLPLLLLALCCGPRPSEVGTGGGVITHQLPPGGSHVASCSAECGNQLNPPTGGSHCGEWLACRAYAEPQSRCSWIHNLEHGHAVLAYHCPEGCPEVVGALEAIWEKSRVNGKSRMVLTPDPLLPRRVAAVVWGWSYSGDEVEETSIAAVLGHQDGEAPEPKMPCPQ